MTPRTPIDTAPPLHLWILGGFRAEGAKGLVPDTAWKRPSGKTLVKLLATEPTHRLHREQILDILWPDLEPASASLSLRKAIHFARHALEPDLLPKSPSSYLLPAGDVLQLGENVWVDANHFESLAHAALDNRDLAALEAAINEYTGDLLPEDRYEDWTVRRHDQLRDLHLRLLVTLADELERRGAGRAAADRLKQLLSLDPTQEEVLRRLMRLYARTGHRHEALRQFQTSRAALRRELDTEPEEETLTLHEDIVRVRVDGNVVAAYPSRSAQIPLPPPVPRLPTTPFIGRERAWRLSMDALSRAEEGTGEMILVGGEAGVGKTRLVAEIAHAGQTRGCIVLWGASYAEEGVFPYGPFVEALDGYVGMLPLVEQDHLAASYPELRSLLPSLEVAGQHETGNDDMQAGLRGRRALLFDAVVRLLDELAGERPLLLVLDDLHASETESLQLLHHLARGAPERRWLITATYREEGVAAGSEVQAFIGELSRRGLCRRVQLLRLGRHESNLLTASFLEGGTPDANLLDYLYTLSLGNALFVRELVEDMRERGELVLRDGRWDMVRHEGAKHTDTHGIPPRIRDLVESRVDRLPDATRSVLNLAAVAGMESSFSDLRAAGLISGSTVVEAEHLVLDALDVALRARILEEGEIGYTFTHPLLRATLYDRLSQHKRAHLHGALARAIEEQRPGEVETLAYHYARSGQHDRAIIYLERAGDRAREVYANDVAIDHYASAIEFLSDDRDATTLARLYRKRADARQLTGMYPEALEDYNQALQCETDGAARVELWRQRGATHEKQAQYDLALQAFDSAGAEFAARVGTTNNELALAHAHIDVEINRALVYLRLGRIEEADKTLVQALNLLDDAPDDLLTARATMMRGMVAQRKGDVRQAECYYLQAAKTAQATGNLEGQSACYGNLGMLANQEGKHDLAVEYLERSLELAERAGDPYAIAMQYNNLAVSAHERGDYDRAEEQYQRSLSLREKLGDLEGLAVCFANLGEIASFRGRYDAAERALHRSLELEAQVGDQSVTAYVWFMLGDVSRSRGRLDEAGERYGRSLEIREGLGERAGIVQSTVALGWVACERGEVEKAYMLARQMRRFARSRSAELETNATLLQARARLLAHRNRVAGVLVDYARAVATQQELGRALVQANLIRAEVLVAQCHTSGAIEAASTALSGARQRGLRLEEAIALRVLGECMPRVDGVRMIRESLNILDEIGAELEAARSRIALATTLRSECTDCGARAETFEQAALLDAARATFADRGAVLDFTQVERILRTDGGPS